MPDQAEVVIVGRDGTEHVFPAGFDPKKAAELVRTRPRIEREPTQEERMDALTADGGRLSHPYTRNLINSARYGAVGSPLIPSTAKAVVGAAKGAASKVADVAGQAGPWIVKAGLRAVGIPGSVVDIAGDVATAYRRRAPTAATPRAPKATASPSAPVASSPAPPTPPAAPSAPGSAPAPSAASGWSPQKLRNEVGLAARRGNLKLSDEQYAQAESLVKSGTAPREAVRAVSGVTAPPKAPAAPSSAPKLKMSAAETKEYVTLRNAGHSDRDAMQAVQAMRALAQKFGTPSTEDVIRRVVDRNISGRWSK